MRIADMSTFMQEQPTPISYYNGKMVRRLIEIIAIYTDKFKMEFKSGETVNVKD